MLDERLFIGFAKFEEGQREVFICFYNFIVLFSFQINVDYIIVSRKLDAC